MPEACRCAGRGWVWIEALEHRRAHWRDRDGKKRIVVKTVRFRFPCVCVAGDLWGQRR